MAILLQCLQLREIYKIYKTPPFNKIKILSQYCGNLNLLQNKQVTMIRKHHDHTLQTNPLHREEATQTPTTTRHQKDNQSKATSFLFLIKIIATLEGHRILKNKTKTKLRTPQKIGTTINNESTTSEPPPCNGQQPKPLGGLNAFYRYQTFALDSVVVKVQTC